VLFSDMQQRGRRSIANLAALDVTGSPPRLTPPSSLSDHERKIFAATVAASGHLRPSDLPLLCRYVEIVALSDAAAERLRADVMKGRPSPWLATQERLIKAMISLARQLRLSPLSRSESDPKTLARHNGGSPSVYETMRLEDGQA
jgi:phage terminase small subunit